MTENDGQNNFSALRSFVGYCRASVLHASRWDRTYKAGYRPAFCCCIIPSIYWTNFQLCQEALSLTGA